MMPAALGGGWGAACAMAHIAELYRSREMPIRRGDAS